MRKISVAVSLIVVTTITGCAGNHETILKIAAGPRRDIFQVVSASQAVSGMTLLNIEFSVKYYKYFYFNTYIKQIDPPYKVVINIDDQVVELTDEPILEDLPGRYSENPEAGKGWKYQFRKTLLLNPGKHRISIAVPLSDVIIEKEVILKEGNNMLKLEPIYNAPITKYLAQPRFERGLRSISIKLNGGVL